MKCKYEIYDLNIYRYSMPLIASNMYIILKGDEALIVDPNESEEALKLLIDRRVKRAAVILTHEHYDHISGVNAVRELVPDCVVYGSRCCRQRVLVPEDNLSAYFAAIFIDRSEEERKQALEIFRNDYRCSVDVDFKGEYDILWNDIRLHMVETPGHSPGSICIVASVVNDIETNTLSGAKAGGGKAEQEKILFSGDSLIRDTKVITRLPGGDKEIYRMVTKPFLDAFPDGTIVFPGHGEEFKISRTDSL